MVGLCLGSEGKPALLAHQLVLEQQWLAVCSYLLMQTGMTVTVPAAPSWTVGNIIHGKHPHAVVLAAP